MMIMRWCSLQTNEHDLQAIMYPIVCKYHRLNIKNGNKVPVFQGYICNRWQNMIVQPSQTHNHGKIYQKWERAFNHYVHCRDKRGCGTLYIKWVFCLWVSTWCHKSIWSRQLWEIVQLFVWQKLAWRSYSLFTWFLQSTECIYSLE